MMKQWRLVSLVSLLALLLGGCGKDFQSTLIPQGEVAKMQYDLLLLSTAIMVLVVLVVTAIFIYVVVKFRQKKGQENYIPKQVEGNHKLEIIWTVIPILLLLVLAVPTVTYTFKLADVKPAQKQKLDKDTIVIDVSARLYWWEFAYKNEKIVTSQDMVIPTGKKVYLNLKGADIKHAFWVPSLAGKIDTNPDNVNMMWLKADNPGTYNGFCTELCGPSHALMQFKVKAVSPEEYEAWTASMNKLDGKQTTASAQAEEGQEIFQKSCIGCHAVDANDARPAAARIAPNLANFGDRELVAGIVENNEENVKQWLKDPEGMKPGNLMTGKYGNLTDEQVDALTAYLLGLKVEK
ncbi:cytochrome c oxidase subunit II [Ectobacillus sp. JY-23]|uniref:cytochrome c oxidase subunit II n=1 Tax=Ectobacillus sp. JY-23 TaxID=2933872 RepID=UPI001FF25BFE|nr:cytochrome c oxidase subunit II [Ectobacillus sp. JY-23]UOY93764.1 cytochrome c oxidase subunit II [Ectobacillus sp. JY-23]